MDFLDPKKKRAHLHRLYAGYALMAAALLIATFILVFAAYGYDIDRRTGGIIQNGLIVVDTHPESAEIYVNQNNMGTTSNRLVLPAGNYNLDLRRSGYRNWSHVVALEGSTIEQLAYPFMFPNKLVTSSIQQFPDIPAMASQSPDRRWILLQTPAGQPSFSLFDTTSGKSPASSFIVPTEILTAVEGKQTMEAIEWSSDNVHLLVKHTYAGGTEFIQLDRSNPSASINLNKTFPEQTISSASMRDKKPNLFYVMDAATGKLLAADVSTHSASIILEHVLSFKSYQNDYILYATNPTTAPENVEIHIWRSGQDHFLRSVRSSTTYLLDMAEFNGHMYVVSGSPADGRVYVYKDPFRDYSRSPARTPQPLRVLIVPAAEFVSFSQNARFITVQGGSNFAVYDIDTNRQFRYDTKLTPDKGQKAIWMDGHRLGLVSQGMVNIFDFDGENIQTLSPSLGSFNPFFDRDYTAMFTIGPAPSAPDKTALQRTELKVLPSGKNTP